MKNLLILAQIFLSEMLFAQQKIQIIDSLNNVPIVLCVAKIDTLLYTSNNNGEITVDNNLMGKRLSLFKNGFREKNIVLKTNTNKIYINKEIKIEEVVIKKMREFLYNEDFKIAKFPMFEKLEYTWLQAFNNSKKSVKIKEVSLHVKIRNKKLEGYLLFSMYKNSNNRPNEMIEESMKIIDLKEIKGNQVSFIYQKPVSTDREDVFFSIQFISNIGNKVDNENNFTLNNIFLGTKNCEKYQCLLFHRLNNNTQNNKWQLLQNSTYQEKFELTPAVKVKFLE